MTFVRQKVPAITLPRVYAYEGRGSQLAANISTPYMLLKGFYKNALQNVEFDLCNLLVRFLFLCSNFSLVAAPDADCSPRAHYISIGNGTGRTGNPGVPASWFHRFDINSRGASFRQTGHGPFPSSKEYFTAVVNIATSKTDLSRMESDGNLHFDVLGTFVFGDIIQNSSPFKDSNSATGLPLNHMDLSTQNILIDDTFNFLATIN